MPMVWAWFDTKEVDALVERLIQDFRAKVPPDAAPSSKKDEERLRRTHDRILDQAREFACNRRVNVYKKARLANRFKWGLLEAGYSKGFVDEVAYELAAVMATPGATGERR
jgi:hypothetical protein